MNPNLTTYSLADQIERHRITSRAELLATRRVRPVHVPDRLRDTARRERFGGVVPRLLGRVQNALPLRRSPALPL